MTSNRHQIEIVPIEAVSWIEDPPGGDPPSPTEAVALSEVFYRRVFTAGLALSAGVTIVAVVLALLQPTFRLEVPIALAAMVLLLAISSLRAASAYAVIRRRNALIICISVYLCVVALVAGSENQELFYVNIVVLSAVGVATSLPATSVASAVAGIGLAAPSLSSPTTVALVAMAMTVPVFFWLLVEYLARFMMRLGQIVRAAADGSPASTEASGSNAPESSVASATLKLPRRADSRTNWHLAAPRWRRVLGTRGRELTARQEQTVFLMCAGFDDQAIADLMGISKAIVRRHLASARARVGVNTRGQLAAWAVKRGLV